MKRTILALTAIICFAITSCESDNSYKSENMIGTWKVVHTKGYVIEDGEKQEWNESVDNDSDYFRFRLMEDQTADILEYDSFSQDWETVDTAKWSLNGNTLKVQDEETGGGLSFKIVSQNKMTLKNYNREGNWEFSEIITFEKIRTTDFL